MKIAFLTETNFEGKWSSNFPNARTEICWQLTLDSYHYNIFNYNNVKNYDCVFVIMPKGSVFLNAEGSKISEQPNTISNLLESNFTEILKNNNKKLCFIQEGGVDRHINDYTIVDQFNYYNHIQNFDIIFSHNKHDILYYSGMFPEKRIEVIPSLMLEHLINNINWIPKDKIMIGGNFSHFYRGFQSYLMASEIKNHSKWTMTSHSMRENEDLIPDLKHLPRLNWVEWLKVLSSFKFGIHLMDLRAAGTFQLNCGFFGIICVGNKLVDTQSLIFPEFSVDVYNLQETRNLMSFLNDKSIDSKWLLEKSNEIKDNYKKHFSVDVWKNKIFNIIND